MLLRSRVFSCSHAGKYAAYGNLRKFVAVIGVSLARATEPVEVFGVGDGDNALLEAADAHETVDEIVAAHDDEIKKSIAVGIGGMEAVVVQENGIETSFEMSDGGGSLQRR